MEMNTFFEKHKLPKLTQEEVENTNVPILIKEFEFAIKIFHTQKKLQA